MSTPRSSRRARRSASSRVQRPELLERVDEPEALPRRGEIHVVAAELDLRRADRVHGDGGHQLLDARHRVRVVGKRLVPLEHRELGLVLVGDALVAEVLADLVDLLEPADDQALEVELGGDAQVEVGVELVRVRDERVGERAAVARLEHRRLDLDEPGLVEVAADGGDHAAPEHERPPRVLVDEQVEVALAVARLRVHEPVVGVGQRPLDLGQEHELVDGQRGLPAPGLGGLADRADDVAEVELDRPRAVGRAEELDLPGAVDEVEEDELPVPAAAEDAPGEPPRLRALGPGLERVGLGADGRDLVPVGKALGQRRGRRLRHGGESRCARGACPAGRVG